MSIEDAKREIEAMTGEYGNLDRLLDQLVTVAIEVSKAEQRALDAASLRRNTAENYPRVLATYGSSYARGWQFGRERAAARIEKGE